jgi:glutathione S-transferase
VSEVVAHYMTGAWGLPSVSPFCLKLDAWLRMTGVPYRVAIDPLPFGASKGKAPWIEHAGRSIGDSGLIIDYLHEQFGVDPDAALSPAELASAHAIRRLIEENLYWVMVHDRWMIDANWAVLSGVVLGGAPAPLRPLIAPLARRAVRAQLCGHGLGRHSTEEVLAIGRRDLDALAILLRDKRYFMSDEATGVDAVAYGMLANLLGTPLRTPVTEAARSHANLAAFVERFAARYYA